MIHRYLAALLVMSNICLLQAQELYVITEPASNMPAQNFGIRLTNKLMHMSFDNSYSYRIEPELMFGIHKNFMLHTGFYASDMFTGRFNFEGGSIYGKYRFMSIDNLHSHFRMAASGKLAVIKNPASITHRMLHYTDDIPHEETVNIYSDEMDLNGNNSGMSGGVIATQLLHKLALSATISYTNRWKNIDAPKIPGISNNALNYSFSTGYLLFPKTYKNYRQVNVNLYAEVLAASALDRKSDYVDIVPAIQFIFNSISRIDIAYRTQLAGNMRRYNTSSWMLRYEYNFLNALSKKSK
ncbi:MAG: hypothetical protein QM768_16590 [Agriterribacter sp.]